HRTPRTTHPMNHTRLQVRDTEQKGRGVFTTERIRQGELVARCSGEVFHESEVPPDCFAMQVGETLWLASPGGSLDAWFNHSCEPKVGFITGEPLLYALRDIEPGEELCWDYSTSISWPGWSLECLCGARGCRGTARPFPHLPPEVQLRLLPIALQSIRGAAPAATGGST